MIYILILLLMFPSIACAQTRDLLDNRVQYDERKVSIGKWDKEVTIDIHTPIELRNETINTRTRGQTTEYYQDSTNTELRVYELPPAKGMENGGIEYEYVFKRKPATNVFEFGIDLSSNIVCYYQPHHQDRRDNADGSYACFHTEKKDHIAGGKNYETGKAFHIYRSKLIDDDGREAWCDYNDDLQTSGKLISTCPQNFLDRAKYPVRLDPTVGYTSKGGSCDSVIEQWASQFSASDDMTVTGISCWVDESVGGSVDFTGGMWSDNGSTRPENLLVSGSAVTMPVGATGGNCDPVSATESSVSNVDVTDDTVWIGGVEDSVSGNVNVAFDTVGGNEGCENNTGVTTLQDPFPTTCTHRASRRYSCYATYTVLSAGERRVIMVH